MWACELLQDDGGRIGVLRHDPQEFQRLRRAGELVQGGEGHTAVAYNPLPELQRLMRAREQL
jgi:hypothetical protein